MILQSWLSGLQSLLALKEMIYLFLGIGFGMFFGLVPGLGGTTGLTLLIPLTFGLDTSTAITLSAGVTGGVPMGASISAILINAPGSAPNAATCLDGFPLAQKGKAGMAIGAAATANALGGLIGTVSLLAIIPLARQIVLAFGPAEFFLMCVLGLVVVSLTTGGKLIEGLLVGAFGLMVATVGYDAVTGDIRYAFGVPYLWKGLPLIPALIGLFPIAQMVGLYETGGSIAESKSTFRVADTLDGVVATFRHWKTVLAGSAVGSVIGAIPGVGGVIAAFTSYSLVSRLSKNNEGFGSGDIRGVIAPEAAINAKDCSTLIPTLAFGIPGSAEMAVFLAILILHGIDPGPLMLLRHEDLIYQLIWALVAACVFASLLGIGLARYLAAVTVVRAKVLAPVVICISLVGSWAVDQTIGNIVVSLVFAVIGYVIHKIKYPRLPLIMSLILGSSVERYYDQAMMLSGGNPKIFFTGPITLVMMILIVGAILSLPVVRLIAEARLRAKSAGAAANA